MRQKTEKKIVYAKDAQSTVLGFVIIMGILLSATTVYLSIQIPERTRYYEFEHESNVLQDFAELSATIDMTMLSEDPITSSTFVIGMAPERILLVGILASGGTLRFQPDHETFECIAGLPDATEISGGGSWNSTSSHFPYYDSFHVDTSSEDGAKLQLAMKEDRIYDSGGIESISGEFRFNNFTVTNGTTLTTRWLTIHAINITLGRNSSIIADGGGLFGGKYEEDGKGEGGGYSPGGGHHSAGGGGAGHNGIGGQGGASRYGTGGEGGSAYGDATNLSADFGSGGAGGACGHPLPPGSYVGGKGGEGGGSILLDAPTINIFGNLSANGEDGRPGPGSNAPDSAGGGGGGGGGGTILFKGGNISIYGYLSAKGGNGGRGGTAWDYYYPISENNGAGGGGGAGGRIKIFYGINLSTLGDLVTHINVSGGAGGKDGDGGDGDNTGEQPGAPGDDGSIYSASINYTESIPHYSAGHLISNVTDILGQGHIGFDVGSEMVRHGTITWDETTPSGTDIALKVRTSLDANMSDALPWEDCPEVTNGQDISDLPSVSDGHRYIQWRAEFLTWDSSRTTVLHSVNLSYEYGIPTLINASGSIEFGSQYLYLPNSNLIYEHGAIIKNQSVGEFMLFSPSIQLSQDDDGNTALKISSVNLTGNESSVSGSLSSSVNAYYQSSALQTGGLNFHNITFAITTQHSTAWKKWFNETCKEAGLEYGTDAGDYHMNETGDIVHVIYYGNESNPVNLWLKSSKAEIEILK